MDGMVDGERGYPLLRFLFTWSSTGCSLLLMLCQHVSIHALTLRPMRCFSCGRYIIITARDSELQIEIAIMVCNVSKQLFTNSI